MVLSLSLSLSGRRFWCWLFSSLLGSTETKVIDVGRFKAKWSANSTTHHPPPPVGRRWSLSLFSTGSKVDARKEGTHAVYRALGVRCKSGRLEQELSLRRRKQNPGSSRSAVFNAPQRACCSFRRLFVPGSAIFTREAI